MGNIRVLSSETINRIAAGEVIERPASIVKELVENSIDSGATGITIEIKNGGISFIRVTDNGSGFDKEDIPTAFLRHATSKIRVDSDLMHIASLGFRGEALSSIASVAKVELLTKKSDDFLGNRYVIEGGEEISFEEAGCPDGTSFFIRDLFYNVPARRKFLKSSVTEAGYINELVNRLAVSHCEISFSLVIQGRTVLHTSGNGKLKDCIYSDFGKEIADNLIPIDYHGELFSVSGYLGKSVINRGNRNYEMCFVNGRSVRSNLLFKSIEEAYASYLMQHKYPFTVLLFEMNPENIDVNIHPTKMDVRFSDQENLSECIRQVLADTIRKAVLIPNISLVEESVKAELPKAPEVFEQNRILSQAFTEQEHKEELFQKTSNAQLTSERITSDDSIRNEKSPISEYQVPVYNTVQVCEQPNDMLFDTKPIQMELQLPKENSAAINEVEADFKEWKEKPQFRILGQVFKTYWIVETAGEMYIIDQHAAHEKIIYERMLHAKEHADVYSQSIMPAIILSLSIREEECLNRYMDTFSDIGFEISHFGGRDYQISAVPSTLYRMNSEEYFLSVLDKLTEGNSFTPEKIYETLASMSCKAAIKGNQTVSELEARHLIEELLTLENPFHCPHGRPIIVSMTQYELEKKFKRIV